MSSADSQSRRHLVDGGARVFLGEALFFPTGLLVVAFLTRRLGPEGYGLLALAMAPVVWVEWSIVALFSRATVKLAGDAGDWRPVGAAVVRIHLVAGLGAAALLVLAAGPLAALLGEPSLAGYLRLYALDIPLVSVAHAHRSLLVGAGGYRQRALAAASRWTARLVLIVFLVQLGLSIPGAILGSIGASLVELAVVRRAIRPSLLGRGEWGLGRLWVYAAPLFLSSLSLRLFDRLDLFMLKALGASTAEAGFYAAAQNLAFAPRILASALSTLLLATLARMLRDGDRPAAADLGRDAGRFALMLFPPAAAAAGSAHEIAALVFGAIYAPSGSLLAVLLFGAVAAVALSFSTAVLTAADRPGWTLSVSWPLVPLATAGHLLVIPRAGALGAALVTTVCAAVGAGLGLLAVRRALSVFPARGTAVRSLFLTACAYGAAVIWPAGGVWVLVKLGVLVGGVAAGFVVLGEFRVGEEISGWRALMPWSPRPADPAGFE